jgi:hypothetical protein
VSDLFASPDERPADPPDVPWSVELGITVFLNRWLFNWRGERSTVERELRELIQRAKGQA